MKEVKESKLIHSTLRAKLLLIKLLSLRKIKLQIHLTIFSLILVQN